MRVLVDTHALIWAVDDPARLSPIATTTLENPTNELLVSAATIWEIAIKMQLKKLILTKPYLDWMNQALSDLRASILPISVDYANVLSSLPEHHRDPFDRLLIAQSKTEAIPIVCADAAFDSYGILRLW